VNAHELLGRQDKQISELGITKIGVSNFGGISHHSTRVRKQKTLKILCFVICVDDYHKLTKTQSLIAYKLPVMKKAATLTKSSIEF
jgi:hypothetical protein